MKRVFRIQGKGKGVGQQRLADRAEVEDVDATVALIQALIPLGL